MGFGPTADDTVSRWIFSETDTPQVGGAGEDDDEDRGDPESNTEACSDDNRTSELSPGTAAAIVQTPVAEVDGHGDRDVGGYYTVLELGGGQEPVFQSLQRNFENTGTGGVERKSTTDWEEERRGLLMGAGPADVEAGMFSVGRGSEDAIARDSREGLLMQDPREDEEPGSEVKENAANGWWDYVFVCAGAGGHFEYEQYR
ncbi:hypothetical protein BDZ91DRAFT_768754 [Kalaharituber pfeilii]|nr:hypothetical protein BDZ91DRAFT_768754 [Kalaharituber pfeilii]